MRPAAATPVASIITRPGPATANEPRWRMCQSVALPSIALYWHIGATTTRLGRVRPRRAIGVKSWLVIMLPVLVALKEMEEIYCPPAATAICRSRNPADHFRQGASVEGTNGGRNLWARRVRRNRAR